ncbi:hypothetical protein B0T16DRAFT_423985 [Cercophora newfieldiana]|uniref:F-box domain-containing protein n=1 Tax=Cercophora newfieldiana TaxID=92897 RepID=A0AA39XTI8_9PEZI|nr:hypothetical protein B0T16DRAFT_423985 [Cercophora newfieldiana]
MLEWPEFVDQELDKANASKAALESIYSALRDTANQLSRPYIRKLTILDLPDELLLQIFAHLDDMVPPIWPRPYELWSPSADIKALRFVCRRLPNIAPHLLIRVVRLNLHEPKSSLARLREISRHPAISKGVHVISVKLRFLDASTTKLKAFISHHSEKIENEIDTYKRIGLWELDGIPEAAAQVIAERKKLVASLDRLSTNLRSNQDKDKEHALQVRVGHQKYLKLLNEQESSVHGDAFFQAVAFAMAMMPCARSLEFDDNPFRMGGARPGNLMIPGADVWECLHSRMLVPLTGDEVKTKGMEPPSLRCIIHMINAVRYADVPLRHLDIKLYSLSRPADLMPDPVPPTVFSYGMRRLQSFRIKIQDVGRNMNGLHEFLSACLGTSSLQALDLDMRGDSEERPVSLRLKDLLNRDRSYNKLTDVFLGNLDLRHNGLIAFLGHLPTPMRRLSINGMTDAEGDF